jgi:hypothetical protein
MTWIAARARVLEGRLRARAYLRWGPWLYERLEVRKLEHLLPWRPLNLVFVASNLARRRYRPEALDVRVEFFRAQREPDTAPTPWEGLARRGVALNQVVAPDIDHDSMMREPHVRLLAQKLMLHLRDTAP